MASLKNSFLLSIAQKYSELIIGFVASMVLARLLLPSEVGTFSVVASLILLAHLLRDFGVSAYLVQEKDLTPEKHVSAFLVTAGWSFLIAAFLNLIAGNIAQFFSRSELESVTRVLSINFLLIPLGSVSLSLLKRKMMFRQLYVVNVAASVVGASMSVFLAFKGFSYMSLAWGSVARTTTTVLLSVYYRPSQEWAKPSRESLRDVLVFGSRASYSQVLFMTVNQLPELLIGRFFGMHSVGIFSRAAGLVKLFHMAVMQGVLPVLLPHFSTTLHKGTGELKEQYLKSTRSICEVAWPFFLFLVLFSDKVILLLFGENWTQAAPIVGWLCVAAAVGNIYSINGQVFYASKRLKEDNRNQTISQFISAAILIAAAFISLKALFVAIILSRLVSCIVSTHYLTKIMDDLTAFMIVKNLRTPLLCVMFTAIPLVLVNHFEVFDGLPLFVDLVLCGLCYLAAWVGGLLLSGSGLLAMVLKRS